ncbi:unnamed protein product [Victoria cruziana]
MLVRVTFLVAASIAAYAVRQFNLGKRRILASDKKYASHTEHEHEEGKEEERYPDDIPGTLRVEDEEEEEEVKRINSVISPALSSTALIDDDELSLPEFEDILSSVVEFPLPTDKFDLKENSQSEKHNPIYEAEMKIRETELDRLRNHVKELEDREVKLEGELLEYYGLKEQETNISELQKQLKIKSLEIDMLNVTISSLQFEKKKLQDEISEGASLRKELEAARMKLKELQRQMQLDTNQTKGHLLLLKQQVTSLKEKEEEFAKRDVEVDKKLKALKDLEVEVVELRRKNKELQHEKRELTMKLDAAEAKKADLSNMTESEMVAKVTEELNDLKHTNEDLLKQVEGLQVNRFSEVEELVYLRWVNACLRYELRNYQTPSGKISARDLSKSLSPKSQERAKKLMLEYAGSDIVSQQGQGDTDLDSLPSTPGSEDFDNASIDSYSSRYNMLKKSSLIQKLKRWGRSRDDSAVASPGRSFGESSPRPSTGRTSMSISRGPLEALMIRNAGDGVAITTFGKKEIDSSDSLDSPNLRPLRTHVPTDNSLNNVAASFQLMSKSVDGVLDEKYPAFKDRHKLALEREKVIKEKADQARAERFGEISKLEVRPKAEKLNNSSLPSARAPAEKKVGFDNKNISQTSYSNDKNDDDGKIDPHVVNKIKLAQIEKRAPRVPRPPPRPSAGSASATSITTGRAVGVPPPPPPSGGPPRPPPPPGGPPPAPPPPGSLHRGSGGGDKVHRAPELVELYQSLMKREAKKEISSLGSVNHGSSDVRSNMIGEIENRSAFLLAVKADVENQGDFVQSLANEIRAAFFTNIEDVVSFVNWLDEELSFLVDERAVLKHFDWPEGKADAFREAAFEYQDLIKLEKRVSSFTDEPKLSCEAALKKMYSLLEKVEQSVYALLRTREMAISRYRDFGIPIDWLLDSGVVGKVKLASVQLARKYMKRVATELDVLSGPDKEPTREFLILQGVRFAFRVHQFAGGFDAESMRAFEELRSRVNSQAAEAVNISEA